ncbi:ArnT family glycosyltransferase [Parablautia muri]|nr:glycosyltransferase family 39 protein [Parablautia muri]
MKKILFNPLKNHDTSKKTNLYVIFAILAFCIATAIAQGTSFFYAPHYTKTLVLTCLFVTYTGLLFYLKFSGRFDEDRIVFMIILLGILFRCSYVLLSGLYERQHDAGAYTGMGTNFVNPGHIGYIEYIYKFHKLPDLNPYELFAYYHPPLHHIISFLWLQLNIMLGVSENLAFENLQILPLFYSYLCMVITWKILKVLEIEEKGLYIGLAFMAFHPATIVMAGSVNNDMLTILFMCLTILESLKWIQNKNLAGLIRLALCIGFGMITKLNSAVLAIPLAIIFLIHFISVLRTRKKSILLTWIKNYFIFAIIVAPIGLSWILRNLMRFGEKPGVPVPGETSPMYTAHYSLWERLGIPAFSDWNFPFPFHPISAKACNNTWVIMFHTSLFAEEYPANLSDILLILCQITFILAVIFGIITALLLTAVLFRHARSRLEGQLSEPFPPHAPGQFTNQKTGRENAIFLLTGYIIMLISFAVFVIIYPYTCSSDFRYVAICLVYISIALGLGNKYYLCPVYEREDSVFAKLKSVSMHIINWGIIMILAFSTVIYIFWERW